jgi:hypothetical protein
MRRFVGAPLLTVVVPVAAGIGWYAWIASDLGQSCGYRNLIGEPSWPPTIAWILLIVAAPLLTACCAITEHRSPRAVVGYAVLAAVFGGVAIGLAFLVFLSSRHCFA